jgi:hypothetical protein
LSALSQRLEEALSGRITPIRPRAAGDCAPCGPSLPIAPQATSSGNTNVPESSFHERRRMRDNPFWARRRHARFHAIPDDP